ncbi:hypothetical protein QVD17_24776 [Tagetes erecta]|uniref:Protein kinase domain-containing protein n=1 Tax=Tagetes erecta TaxID=13708 RepID=A0AAD8KIE2_TARER|nr:hypothetical protein QVD17_24776 [Tagetes erecta]
MFSSFSLLFFFVLLFSTTITQPYKATDVFFVDCGSSDPFNSSSDNKWGGDEHSRFVPSNARSISFSSTPDYLDASVARTPFSTARVFKRSSFTYTFPVSQGPKFLRLHFYPATYSNLIPEKSFFSVSSNGYSLLTNFSAFLAASFLTNSPFNARLGGPQVYTFVKEFLIYVKDTQILNVTFTPSHKSFAFINGIEIVSMPENLYFNKAKIPKPVGMVNGPVIDNNIALENMYRLNMGGPQIYGNIDTEIMYRSWYQDNDYLYGNATGVTPYYLNPIMYTIETPNYTAPELVYRTQRSMGKKPESWIFWIFPVDVGFYYMLRLHFCNIIPQYKKSGQTLFKIFFNTQEIEEEADLFYWTQGTGYPVYRDYVVFVDDLDGSQSKHYFRLSLHPNTKSEAYLDAFLNGLEVFKLSMDRSLASPNPELISTNTPTVKTNKKKTKLVAIISGIGGALVLLSLLVLVVFWQRRRVKHLGSIDSTLPLDRCRRFSLREVKAATDEFNDDFVIGNGGFGKVYRGYMDRATTIVAIKRLNSSSTQGFQEFITEIGLLSRLRHVQLVSLIGYCDDEGEMILVYDYMAHGTLREHLYKTNKPPLSWRRRLDICIGAAKGLHYLHTGAKRAIIHRDIKSTNILLDENWVAKVSDFGLSKLGPRDQGQDHVSTLVKGSIGYVDPQYYRSKQLTDRSDVYSFGVVLLEVLCARPVRVLGLPKEQVSLAAWGKFCYLKGTLHEIIDPELSGVIAPECLRQFGMLAVSCLNDESSERPGMDEVVWGLEFALELQELADKTIVEAANTIADDTVIGSIPLRDTTTSISSGYEEVKSE